MRIAPVIRRYVFVLWIDRVTIDDGNNRTIKKGTPD